MLEEQTSTCVSSDKLTKVFKETTDKHPPQKKQRFAVTKLHLWKKN